MQRTMTLGIALLLVLVGAVAPTAAAEPNPEQSGDNSACADYNALYLVMQASPLAAIIEVDPGTNFTASHDGGAAIYIDWWNADGSWAGWNGGATEGTVPDGIAYGTICVGLLDSYPDAPAPAATWTYQDGFA